MEARVRPSCRPLASVARSGRDGRENTDPRGWWADDGGAVGGCPPRDVDVRASAGAGVVGGVAVVVVAVVENGVDGRHQLTNAAVRGALGSPPSARAAASGPVCQALRCPVTPGRGCGSAAGARSM